jgi:hypothetical protein
MKRWKIASLIAAAAAALLLVLAGLIAFTLPGVVKNRLPPKVEAATGRKLSIGGISVNPFTWTVQVRDLRFSERGSRAVFAEFSTARITLSPLTLLRLAPVVSAASISSPHLHITREGAESYNFSDLRRWLPVHPRLTVANLVISHGSLDFTDRGREPGKPLKLRSIELAIPFITGNPAYADRFITPRMSALLDGSHLDLEGKFRPLRRPTEISLSLKVNDICLPCYQAYLPAHFAVRVDSGKLSGRVALYYRAPQLQKPGLSLSGSLALDNLKLSELSGAPLCALNRLEAQISSARPQQGNFELSSLSADGLEVYLTRDHRGVWSHRRLVGRAEPGAEPRHKILVAVKETRLRKGRLHFTDQRPPGGFTTDLNDVTLDMRDYSTAPGKKATYTLSLTSGRGEKGSLTGEFSPNPLTTSAQVELTGLQLETYRPYFAGLRRARTRGAFDAAGILEYDRPKGLRLTKVSARAREFSAQFAPWIGAEHAVLSLDGGSYSQQLNRWEVADFALKSGELTFTRRPGGTGTPAKAQAARPTRAASGAQGTSRPPLSYRIAQLSGFGLHAVFAEVPPNRRPAFALDAVDFNLKNLAKPPAGALPFKAAARHGTGSLRTSGSFTPQPRGYAGEVTLQSLPLGDFAPYLPQRINVVLAGGKLDARLALSLASSGGRLSGGFSGFADFRALYCLDAAGEDLISWKSLRLDRIKGTLSPFSLVIATAALDRFSARVVIEKDGKLNLRQQRPGEPGREAKAPPSAGTGRQIRIGTAVLRDGTLSFTDHHVAGGYSTKLFNLGGTLGGLSSEANRLAEVDLHGNLENQSPLAITGRLNPLSRELYADLTVSFTGIELPPLSPYSGTYLGYGVDRGKLFLDSKYRIVNSKLDSSNHVLIDQLDLGKHIDSDKAIGLPVRLAVALLKDRKGEIHLDIPVTGRLNDPHFSFWRVALNALKELAKAPFTFFQSRLGTKEELSRVRFAAGSHAIIPGEREKLLLLAGELNDRPALRIVVAGFVDRDADAKVVGVPGLPALAEARAAGVRAVLGEKLDGTRIFLVNGDIYRAPGQPGEPGSRVELEVTAE